MLTYLDRQIEQYLGDARDVVSKLGRRCPVACFDAPYRLTPGDAARSSDKHKVMSGGWMADYDNSGLFMVYDITWKEIMQLVVSCLADDADVYAFANDKIQFEAQREAFDAGLKFHNMLAWDKKTATANRFYMMNLEFILYLYQGRARRIANCGDKQLVPFPHRDFNCLTLAGTNSRGSDRSLARLCLSFDEIGQIRRLEIRLSGTRKWAKQGVQHYCSVVLCISLPMADQANERPCHYASLRSVIRQHHVLQSKAAYQSQYPSVPDYWDCYDEQVANRKHVRSRCQRSNRFCHRPPMCEQIKDWEQNREHKNESTDPEIFIVLFCFSFPKFHSVLKNNSFNQFSLFTIKHAIGLFFKFLRNLNGRFVDNLLKFIFVQFDLFNAFFPEVFFEIISSCIQFIVCCCEAIFDELRKFVFFKFGTVVDRAKGNLINFIKFFIAFLCFKILNNFINMFLYVLPKNFEVNFNFVNVEFGIYFLFTVNFCVENSGRKVNRKVAEYVIVDFDLNNPTFSVDSKFIEINSINNVIDDIDKKSVGVTNILRWSKKTAIVSIDFSKFYFGEEERVKKGYAFAYVFSVYFFYSKSYIIGLCGIYYLFCSELLSVSHRNLKSILLLTESNIAWWLQLQPKMNLPRSSGNKFLSSCSCHNSIGFSEDRKHNLRKFRKWISSALLHISLKLLGEQEAQALRERAFGEAVFEQNT